MRFLPLSLMLLTTMLTACDGQEMRETIGLTRTAPDEFVVVSRPPLSVPPDFDLKPPRPGETRKEESTRAQARQLILKEDSNATAIVEDLEPASKKVETAVDPVITSDAKSSAESNLLSKLGVDKADPNIRTKLGAEAAEPKDLSKEKSLYERIIKSEGGDEPVVDAKKEAERIRTNKETGKPINEGEVPEAEENTSVIDRIF